jgi:hypothetical protein
MGYGRYRAGLLICVGIALYGLWLISLSWRGKTVTWLRGFGDVRKTQVALGLLMQLPLPAYLWLGASTGILERLRWTPFGF